ncbi:hypothetical protein K443DRAFT_179133 [Laccaria amethystina LaAM-08-1]|uniref:Uncharacterized protein n=1 Tax=Laccaria amethystina LaAM-08-1 TaxID=1095629 RepID=A0A0C9XTE1_9AGAR|nr:hypothetical protein K443DRAFT_179133 [Laccaria amethystina LaAM-08-1]
MTIVHLHSDNLLTVTQLRARRGRRPRASGPSSLAGGNGDWTQNNASSAIVPAANIQRTNSVQAVPQPVQHALAPAAGAPPHNRQVEDPTPNPQVEVPTPVEVATDPPTSQVETTHKEDQDTGLKEVERFLRTCNPSLIHLLDHLAHYGCVDADFLKFLARRAARLKEEDFLSYLRNHFSNGLIEGQNDLTEMEILVLTEGLLTMRGG